MVTAAFIPARKTSSRFPEKNLQPWVDGRPLIRVALELAADAKRNGFFDRVIFTRDWSTPSWRDSGTDSDGVEHEIRSEEMRAPSIRVIDLLRDWLGRQEEKPGAVCVMVPTSPLRTMRHLVESYRLFEQERADVALSVVTRAGAYRRKRDSVYWFSEPEAQEHDGTVLWCRSGFALSEEAGGKDGFYASCRIVEYAVPSGESADINRPIDLEWARFLHGLRPRT